MHLGGVIFDEEKYWALVVLCPIVFGPQFQNFNFKRCEGPQQFVTVTLKITNIVLKGVSLRQGGMSNSIFFKLKMLTKSNSILPVLGPKKS